MASIPKFKTLEEAAEFWDTHDFEDFVDETEHVTIAVTMPSPRKALTIPLETKVYEQLEALAALQGVPAARLASLWLAERVMAESKPK